MKKFLFLVCALGGICLLSVAAYLLFERYEPRNLKFETIKIHKGQNIIPSVPVGIIIKSANVSLPVVPAIVVNNNWQTTNSGVSYLTSTPLPGKNGNAVFYGHDFPNLLGNLWKVKTGEKIEVVSENGSVLVFKISDIKVVSSDDMKILESSTDKRITVYTCTGFLDSKRLVVTAVLSAN